jgi:hypothetical protein
VDHSAAEGPAERTSARLAGRGPAELAAELRTAAADCATMATLLGAGGEDQAASRLARQADGAAFEAYIVMAAARGGDHALATVDLRWDLVTEQAADQGAEQSGRERFDRAVGSAERPALHAALRSALDLALEPVEAP